MMRAEAAVERALCQADAIVAKQLATNVARHAAFVERAHTECHQPLATLLSNASHLPRLREKQVELSSPTSTASTASEQSSQGIDRFDPMDPYIRRCQEQIMDRAYRAY